MASYQAIAEAAVEVARERARTLEELRLALLQGDDEAALRLARELAGLGPSGGNRLDRGVQ